MKKVTEKLHYPMNVAPEEAWEVIGRVGGVDQWFSSMIVSCKVDGDKRHCVTADGTTLEEQILEVNHQTKTFSFGIPKQDLQPVENIVETMKVLESVEGKTIIEWSAVFDTAPENVEMTKKAFRDLWAAGLKEMESYIIQQKVS